jgi:hypothetical protein
MPVRIPVSVFGAFAAVIYAAVAIWVLIQDRAPGGGGDWISLRGMSSYIVTMPVSAPCELMGAKLDYKRNLDMVFAIGGCAVLVYLVGQGLAWLTGQIFPGRPDQ